MQPPRRTTSWLPQALSSPNTSAPSTGDKDRWLMPPAPARWRRWILPQALLSLKHCVPALRRLGAAALALGLTPPRRRLGM